MKAVDLKATALVTGSPIFGTPTLRQVHRLIAEPLVANGPVFNEPTKSRKRKGRDAPSRKRAARFAQIGPSRSGARIALLWPDSACSILDDAQNYLSGLALAAIMIAWI